MSLVTLAFSERCVEDRIVDAVHAVLLADQQLVKATQGQIYRRHILRPPLQGSPVRMIVAPVYETERFRASKTAEIVLRVGIMLAFEDFEENLKPGTPSVLTVLSHAKSLVTLAQPFTENGETLAHRLSWTPMEAVPIVTKPDVVTAFTIGEIAELTVNISRTSRERISSGG